MGTIPPVCASDKLASRRVFALKGQPQTSPGQSGTTPVVPRRPGLRAPRTPPALKGRNMEPPEIVPPFQGFSAGWAAVPRAAFHDFVVSLCPGLVCRCPFGAEERNVHGMGVRSASRTLALVMCDFRSGALAVNGWRSPSLRRKALARPR